MSYVHNVCEQFILDNRWLFDVEQDRLVDLEGRAGTTLLKPGAARILALLARSPQALLRRRELFQDGWNRFGFEVCENSLNQVMCTLRNMFETLDPGHPYIKTVPRIGYCLLVEARPAVPGDHPGEMHPTDLEPDFSWHGMANGLAGRRIFEETADMEWRRAHRTRLPLSALRIELNRFEDLRNLHGGVVADDALMRVTQCVRQNLNRAGDSMSHCQNDTLAVLLAHTDEIGAVQVGKRIDAAVRAINWCRRADPCAGLTISIGMVCSTPGRFETLQAFLDALEGSLHEAKRCVP